MMRIESPYHEGELAIQTMASERTNADRNGRAIADSIMPGALKFIAQRRSGLRPSSARPGATCAAV